MSKNKVCNRCKKSVPSKEMSKSKKHTCSQCVRDYQNERYRLGFTKKQIRTPHFVSNLKGNVGLKFLVGLRKPSKKEWTYAQVKEFVNGVRLEIGESNFDFKAIYEKHGSGKSYNACNSMRNELTRAGEEGMTLLGYWNAGRPFSDKAKANEVIVGPKEEKKKK